MIPCTCKPIAEDSHLYTTDPECPLHKPWTAAVAVDPRLDALEKRVTDLQEIVTRRLDEAAMKALVLDDKEPPFHDGYPLPAKPGELPYCTTGVDRCLRCQWVQRRQK